MIAPYAVVDGVTLYHGNCLEISEWLAADVLVTDPPYGTQFSAENPRGGYGRRYLYDTGDGMGATIAGDDGTATRDASLAKWGDKPAALFGSPRLADPPMAVADRLVWNKLRPGMNGGPFRYQHESIYLTAGFVRVDDSHMSIMVSYPDQSQHIHCKPIPIMERLVECAPPGVVADPFAGSGSTLIAARNLGRQAIGVEIEERYCELIVKRLEQSALFVGGAE